MARRDKYETARSRSIPSAVASRFGAEMMPVVSTTVSQGACAASSAPTRDASFMLSRSARMNLMLEVGPSRNERPTTVTSAPALALARASSRPRPPVPPMTTTRLPDAAASDAGRAQVKVGSGTARNPGGNIQGHATGSLLSP